MMDNTPIFRDPQGRLPFAVRFRCSLQGLRRTLTGVHPVGNQIFRPRLPLLRITFPYIIAAGITFYMFYRITDHMLDGE
ncbi:MAG: hypothetical protein BJ554DRAFT_3357 [Olpidium bornovanus]|uniref:Uncharacterized protein n=1 Tax=Olpidium bornovanus TaxID=278681 RepID=A0A8H7ZPE6_9FUNG|nr:MAG: hypothetical protein BJ554DRAFT_3357 [Olpidium bornovanus]